MSEAELEPWASARRAELDALLAARIPPLARAEDPGRLVESIRYSLLAPGKRLRPLLALAAAEAVGALLSEPVRIAAASIELVHCYSLVHDDLPAMDDDDLRRGQPTNHKVFGEAIAILAGDGLLTLAFEWVAEAGLSARQRGERGDYLRAALALARGAGVWGMVRGQARDLAEAAPATVVEIEQLHREKTGGLFRAAVEIGGAVGGATEAQLEALVRFGEAYGVAFQHADDLDDAEHGGLAAQARTRMVSLVGDALTAVQTFDQRAEPLRAIAQALARRAGGPG
ncbi:MAG TPA: polyprenyl synthetase family protein [Polyangia bacterium]|nr:polyprenyl synthetase family protein [Polyangia bacterium]